MTQVGRYSYDSETGGYFTKTLLQVSTAINPETYKPFFIEQILPFLPKALKKEGNSQTPEVTYQEGNMKVPFTIGIPKMVFPKPMASQRKYVPANTNSSGSNLLLGLVLLLIAASK